MVIDRTQTIEDAADELDISVTTLQRYVQKGAPVTRRGRGKRNLFNAAEILVWMRDQGLTGNVGKPGPESSSDLDAARLRKENALASRYELMVEKERGLVVPTDYVIRVLQKMLQTARNKLVSIPSAVSPRLMGLDTAEIQDELEKHIDNICRELSNESISKSFS